MSKVSCNTEVVREVLHRNQRKPRKFLETVDQLEELRPSEGQMLLGHHLCKSNPHPKFSACALGHQQHCNEAKAMDLSHMDIKELKKLNKNKKLVKMYHSF